MFRSDGLLRGARDERIEAMRTLADGGWNLKVFLGLHCGLLDHAEDVRAAAMEALQEIAKQKPASVELTPVELLSEFLFDFTVSSGVRLNTFEFLVELDTPEAEEAIIQVLLRTERNEDFSDFIRTLQRRDKLDSIRMLNPDRLSKSKAAMLHSALGKE